MSLNKEYFIGDTWTVEYESLIDATAGLTLNFTSATYNYSTPQLTSIDGKYTFTISTAITANFLPGSYNVSILRFKDGTRTVLETGDVVKVNADPLSSNNFSYARRMVEAIEALLENRFTNSHAMYSQLSFEGRALTQLSPGELYSILKKFKEEVAQEELSKTFGKKVSKNKIKVWFRNV